MPVKPRIKNARKIGGYVPNEDYKWLESRAKKEDVSVNKLVREAVRLYRQSIEQKQNQVAV